MKNKKFEFISKTSCCLKTKKNYYRILYITIFLFLFSSITFGQQKAPNIWLDNLEGEAFDNRRIQTPYVISFFYIDCVPCKKEIPQLYQFMEKEFPSIPLLFIDPIREDSETKIRAFAKTLGVPLSYFYHDPFANLAKKYFQGEMLFPSIFVIEQRKILSRQLGLTTRSLQEIRKALKN